MGTTVIAAFKKFTGIPGMTGVGPGCVKTKSNISKWDNGAAFVSI
jgi:hypothetical protein